MPSCSTSISGLPEAIDTSSTKGALPPSATPTAKGAEKTACELITPNVIKAADFTYRVVRQTKSNGVGKNGASGCTYGDDPDPTHISFNFLSLLIMTPAALKAEHATAKDEAKAVADPCTAESIRKLGPNAGIGSYAYFCVASRHSPAGGWIQGRNVYLLAVGTPIVDYGTTTQRVSEFETVARVIATNIGR